VYDGLVGFRRAAGVAGTAIVADLATSVPAPAEGGKTYVFHLRRGIRYSNGSTVKAGDFATVFKRQFTVPGPADSFYQGIVGGGQCAKSPRRCNLSKGVVTDNAAGTVTFHLTAPDPEFLDKLALPFAVAVPATTPLHDMGNTPVPGTGLYMWKSYQPSTAAVMVRNPYFHVWSKDAQPAGNPNEIEFKFGLNFPGYKPYCPFTLHAGASGRWSAPDLAKARQLVRQSGTRGAHVAVVGTTDTVGKAITLQFVQDLNRIGYVATPKLLSNAIQYPYIQDSRNHVQVAYSQWFQDYPAASDFLNVLLGCGYFHPGSDASPISPASATGLCRRR